MMSKEELDIEQLIDAIRVRPALYQAKLKEYSDKYLKSELWNEIFQELIENWEDLGEQDKIKKGIEIQKRWKNLRTCFKRELLAQKSVSGPAAKKRRKYIYFDQLSFLQDHLKSSTCTSDSLMVDITEEEENENEMQETSSNSRVERKAPQTHSKTIEESILEILKEKKDEEIDEDKYFLLSLLPQFKKFNDDQKFVARTEIMTVMRQVCLFGGVSSSDLSPRRSK